MQTEILQEFIAVANHLSFRKAAEEMHLTRPALSKHITALENELGFALFDRSRTTKLTLAGEYFYLQAQQVLGLLQNSISEAKRIALADCPLRILYTGQESKVLERILMATTVPYTMSKPEIAASGLSMLKENKVDVAVIYLANEIPELAEELRAAGTSCLPLCEERLSLLMSRDNKLASKPCLTRQDLQGAEIMHCYGRLFDQVAQTVPYILGEDIDVRIIRNPSLNDVRDVPYCKFGQQIMLGLRYHVQQICEQAPQLVSFDELDGEPICTKAYIVYRADNPNRNLKAFLKECRESSTKSSTGSRGASAVLPTTP